MTTTNNAGSGVTRYLQVYTVLSQALDEGIIAPGEALPSEPTLVREYGVSRTTVRRALARLATEGSIVRRRGSGTFARGRAEPFMSARQIAATFKDLPNLPSNTTINPLLFKSTATPDFLHREWPEFGDTVTLVRRVRYLKQKPIVLVTAYLPQDIGSQLSARHLGKDAMIIVLDKLGYRGFTSDELISATAADPQTARHLHLGIGAPVLCVKRIIRDARERIICYCTHVYRADRYEIHIILERDGKLESRVAGEPREPGARTDGHGRGRSNGGNGARRT